MPLPRKEVAEGDYEEHVRVQRSRFGPVARRIVLPTSEEASDEGLDEGSDDDEGGGFIEGSSEEEDDGFIASDDDVEDAGSGSEEEGEEEESSSTEDDSDDAESEEERDDDLVCNSCEPPLEKETLYCYRCQGDHPMDDFSSAMRRGVFGAPYCLRHTLPV